MKKQKSVEFEDFAPIERVPVSEQKVFWGIHYVKNPKTQEWSGYRLSCSCEKTMKKLVENWKTAIDSDGVYRGEIKGNKYPEIPDYENQ